jgi:hypothetical protein
LIPVLHYKTAKDRTDTPNASLTLQILHRVCNHGASDGIKSLKGVF